MKAIQKCNHDQELWMWDTYSLITKEVISRCIECGKELRCIVGYDIHNEGTQGKIEGKTIDLLRKKQIEFLQEKIDYLKSLSQKEETQ